MLKQALPPIVCLDNNDYSSLSDPRRTQEQDAIRRQLLELARSGQVIFAFAGTHLMEMAPLTPEFTGAAAARADLLVDLCGRNALVSPDRVLEAELACAIGLATVPVEVLTADATWFPRFDGALFSPFTDDDRHREVKQLLREQSTDRTQRRKFERKLFKHGQPTVMLKSLISNAAANSSLESALRSFPMRGEDAAVLSRYAWGQASAQEAELALLNSLRDPRWMMRWFAEHHDTMSSISRWIREPSERYIAGVQEAMLCAKEIHRLEEESGTKIKNSPLTSSARKARQDNLLLNVANRLVQHHYPGRALIEDVRHLENHCPGLSTTLLCVCSTAWDSFGVQSRLPKSSDFADALHALYAPYVSIFRADSYMAPHVTKHVKRRGTQVVGKLKDLPRQILKTLGQGSSISD